jgi:hypothetical protein
VTVDHWKQATFLRHVVVPGRPGYKGSGVHVQKCRGRQDPLSVAPSWASQSQRLPRRPLGRPPMAPSPLFGVQPTATWCSYFFARVPRWRFSHAWNAARLEWSTQQKSCRRMARNCRPQRDVQGPRATRGVVEPPPHASGSQSMWGTSPMDITGSRSWPSGLSSSSSPRFAIPEEDAVFLSPGAAGRGPGPRKGHGT